MNNRPQVIHIRGKLPAVTSLIEMWPEAQTRMCQNTDGSYFISDPIWMLPFNIISNI